MHRCQKCGYREFDWPMLLWIAAFFVLDTAFKQSILSLDRARRFEFLCVEIVAGLLFFTGLFWRVFRERKAYKEYFRLHPPPTQRVKDHLKPSPSQ
jgi:hypothetical protein